MRQKRTDEPESRFASERDDWLARRSDRFEARYHRPLPWYEVVEHDEMADLAWDFSTDSRLAIARTRDFEKVLSATYPIAKPVDHGGPELLLGSKGLLTGDALLVVIPESQKTPVRLPDRDVDDFWELLGRYDNMWIVAPFQRWILWQDHDHDRGAPRRLHRLVGSARR